MENTAKEVCRMLADVMEAHGVRRAFVSPGSRNAPLLVALARKQSIAKTVVIDERSAAFAAVGYAAVSGEPVALVCTSGTALLNYAPAVAEAYYRRLPLIVVSADRPQEWIDQDDSQTLRQPGALSNYVKLSHNITDLANPGGLWFANRVVNDALIAATSGRKAPVHINIQLDEPLNAMTDDRLDRHRVIHMLTPREDLTVARSRELGCLLASPRKVMIVAGFHHPEQRLNKALGRLAAMPNIVVLTETIANLHSPGFISRIDTTLSAMTPEEKNDLAPDVVITLGGALVSRFIKTYLRSLPETEHWHVGISHTTIDCMQSLTLRVEMEPGIFFQQLASAIQPHTSPSDYSDRWHVIADRAVATHQAYIASAPWSDLKAFSVILPGIPRRWNLQLSNGTPIRYSQLFGDLHIHRTDCNRGVSGIDGCTSTAIGASMAYDSDVTLLISGDMSAQYDVGALACRGITSRFKMLVICNGGGGIFRFIPSTSCLPELDDYFTADPEIPLRQLADAYGFAFFEASDEASLRCNLALFASECERPAMMAVRTPPETSAEVLSDYFKRDRIFKNQHNDNLT